MGGLACYDSDASAGNGDEHGGNGDASDNDDASLDYISSSVGDAPAIGSVDTEMVVFTAGDELPDTSATRGPAERAAARARAPMVNPFGRRTNATNCPAVAPPAAPLRAQLTRATRNSPHDRIFCEVFALSTRVPTKATAFY
jgi:hypothetical protein